MRKVLVVVGLLALGASGALRAAQSAVQAKPAEAMKVCTVKVTGMTCGGCEAAVKLAAKKVTGVKEARASYSKGIAEVTYDPSKTTPDAIAKAIAEKTGYKAEVSK